jgi:hypothetical protein
MWKFACLSVAFHKGRELLKLKIEGVEVGEIVEEKEVVELMEGYGGK